MLAMYFVTYACESANAALEHARLYSSSDEYFEQELEMDDSIVQYLSGVNDPEMTIQTVRSIIAISGLMITAFPIWCGLGRLFPAGVLVSQGYYLNGFIGGLWIMFKSHKRQSEMTLYFTRLMLESMWHRMVKAGHVRNIK
ncbi:hypothetical protein BGX34_001357 [Mortierella sp. NVP85]|nr:hypothetical protein BGX34_001357 [Mortierella sp. NVP85]